MTEMQAAIGRIQLKRMPDWIDKRNANAAKLNLVAEGFKLLRVVYVPSYIRHAEYKHYVFIHPEFLADGWTRDRIVEEINALDVPCFQGSCSEVYLEKAFNNTGWRPEKGLKNAKELGETSLMFLVHPTLTNEEMDQACKAVQQVIESAQAD